MAKKKKKSDGPGMYEVSATITYQATWTIEADSAEDAESQASCRGPEEWLDECDDNDGGYVEVLEARPQ